MVGSRPVVAGLLVLALPAAGCTGAARAVGRPTRTAALPVTTLAVAAALPAATSPTASTGLVWSPNRVPASVRRAGARFSAASVVVVANGTVWLPTGHQAPPGMAKPVDVSAAPPRRYAAAVPSSPVALRRLTAGHVVVSVGSAHLRGLHVGSRMRMGFRIFRVSAVVPNPVIGYAEMFVTGRDGRRLNLPPYRYMLVRPDHQSAWPRMARVLRRAVPASTPVQILAPGTPRALRQAASV